VDPGALLLHRETKPEIQIAAGPLEWGDGIWGIRMQEMVEVLFWEGYVEVTVAEDRWGIQDF
jgi:hypothetical protein